MRRTILGSLSLALLMGAGGLVLRGMVDEYPLAFSACLRMGLVLGAIWLAYEQVYEIVRRTPPWMMGGAALGLLVVVIRPRAIVAVGPLLATAAALHWLGKILNPGPRPKKNTNGTNRPRKSS